MPEAKGTTETRKKTAAFFDVDKTLIRGDTQEMEGRLLMSREWNSPLRAPDGLLILGAAALHRMGRISLDLQNRIYLRIYRGRTREELAALGQEVFDRCVRQNLLAGAVSLLEERRSKGDRIVLVSATTPHLVAPLARVLRPDHVFCTQLEFTPRGRATGRAAGGILLGQKKVDKIRAFAEELGLDLSACHAYSDHHADLPMLSCVGYPEVVNPTPDLSAHAQARNWPVHQFSA